MCVKVCARDVRVAKRAKRGLYWRACARLFVCGVIYGVLRQVDFDYDVLCIETLCVSFRGLNYRAVASAECQLKCPAAV